VKSFLHHIDQVAHIFDQEIVFDDGAGDADGVAFLEGIQANRVGGHLPGDDDHRDAVHVGCGNACDGIGHAGTRGDQRHTHITRGTCIAVSSMNSCLLVAHQNVLNRVLFVKRVVDVQYGATGVAPEVFDVFCLQGFDKNV
jgi:hypothetical protein